MYVSYVTDEKNHAKNLSEQHFNECLKNPIMQPRRQTGQRQDQFAGSELTSGGVKKGEGK